MDLKRKNKHVKGRKEVKKNRPKKIPKNFRRLRIEDELTPKKREARDARGQKKKKDVQVSVVQFPGSVFEVNPGEN